MKLPFVPGPSDVRAAVDGVREGVGEAIDLVPRLARIVTDVEGIVARVDTLLERVEGVVDRAEQSMTGLDATRARADAAIEAVGRTQAKADDAITAVGRTQAKADDAITAVGGTTGHADRLLGRAEGIVDRTEPLVRDYSEPMAQLAPAVRRLAETLEPDEVEAVVRMIDQLPHLATQLELLLPVLGSMDNVGDDVHDLLETMQDLRQVVKGFPGSRLFRRRGAEEIAGEDDEERAAGV
jgi:ABC-type transporter Mla subunit MlaD